MTNLKVEDPYKTALWKSARIGIIAVCILHFILAILLGNKGYAVIFNFLVSKWIIQQAIKKNKIVDKSLMYGIIVSIITTIVQFALGALVSIYLKI